MFSATAIAYVFLAAAVLLSVLFGFVLTYHLLRFSPRRSTAIASIIVYACGAAVLLFALWGAVLSL